MESTAKFMMRVANAEARDAGRPGHFRPSVKLWVEVGEGDVIAAAKAMHEYEYTSRFEDQPASEQQRLKDLARVALESFAAQIS